jgi:GDPmannose 4,6-dehydratase
MKKALITGVTGQDGSYLAEFLLEKGYEVHGMIRRSSSYNQERLEDLLTEEEAKALLDNSNFHLHYGDVSDTSNVIRLIGEIKPDEIYNLAAQSHVRVSFDMPGYTLDVDGKGTLNILEAVRILGLTDKTKVYQASKS